MIRSTLILWLSAVACLLAAERSDLLRFTNGDQLHGTFCGIQNGLQAIWQRDDVNLPVEFKTTSIRHIVINGGRPLKSLESLSNVTLVNGDRVPGIITAIDDEQITLETTFAGALRIPRSQTSIISPNPLGGRVYYHGPFSKDDWKMKHVQFPDGLPQADAKDPAKPENEKTAAPAAEDEPPGQWVFSGSAWYWQNKSYGTALIREKAMPDRAVLSFDLAWKNRLSFAIAFNADFCKAKPKEANKPNDKKVRIMVPNDSSELPRLFGNSYVLQLTANYLMLYRSSVDDNGNGSVNRSQINTNSLRLGETGNAKVEIRSNRLTGGIFLFVNDEFVAQWSANELAGFEGADTTKMGSGFGFVTQGTDSQIRISDLVVSEWNGMPDSARSLQMDDQDVVLMANGTDRFAGKVGKLGEDGKVRFEGKHGTFLFPLNDVAEIRFARSQQASASEPPANNVIVRLAPIGAISGTPISGDVSTLVIHNPIIGELNLSTAPAVMLEFNASKNFINSWDADF